MENVVTVKIDAMWITGCIAYNEVLMEKVTERIKFIAHVKMYHGEDEMGALASNGYEAINGVEKIKI